MTLVPTQPWCAAVELGLAIAQNGKMRPELKYARVERERRFLVERLPDGLKPTRVRRIHDWYLDGTRLRLREQSDDEGGRVLKLTQKIAAAGEGAQQGFLTSLYLNEDEFHTLATLPAKKLNKTRHSLPPFGIDLFEGELEGLLLAEAEFDSSVAEDRLTIPDFIGAEVSHDPRFTGGRLAGATRAEVRRWMLEYGIGLGTACD